ncbi:MAG: hypothetical protein GF403_04195 [Candidatus Coatesbacteria bacterium]|nr:hypothetical protein [Candidatus Coatesbacteria bacterium]
MVYGLADYAAGYDNVKLGFVLSGTDTYDNLDGLLIDNLEIRGEAGSRTEVASFGEIKGAYH